MREEGHGCAIATIILLLGIIGMLILVIFMFREPSFELRNALPEWAKEALFGDVEETTKKEEQEETKKPAKEVVKLKSHTEYYTENDGKVSVEYPIVNGMDELEVEEALNNKLRVNAASIVALLPVDVTTDFLNIHCDVEYLNKDKVVITYRGTYQKGQKAKQKTTTKSSSTTKQKTTSTPQTTAAAYDPYLNGFVDPFVALPSYNSIANVNQGAIIQAIPNQSTNQGGLPPVANSSASVNSGSAVVPNSANANGTVPDYIGQIDENGVSSKGPTVNIIERPTAAYASTDTNGYTNIFYTNVIDFLTLKDIYLVKTVDTQKLAKFVMSDSVAIENAGGGIDSDKVAKIKKYIKSNYTETKLKAIFDKADFRNDKLTDFPSSFSYTLGKTTYVSLKVSAELGDYVIIRYEQ